MLPPSTLEPTILSKPLLLDESSLTAEAPATGSETLLLAEDELAVLQPTQEFFTMNGYNVPEAKNGEDALTITRNNPHPIHLMITDVVMPQIGGARLAEQMAVERPETKVLFVSGYAENTLQRQGVFDI